MSTSVCKFGTLLELASTGKADQFFIDGPSSSLFRRQLNYCGNYAIDWCVKDTFEGHGVVRRATLSQEGDLCIGMMVKNAGKDFSYRFLIGGQCVTSGRAVAEGFTYRRRLNKPIYADLDFSDKTQSVYSQDLTFISPAGCHYVETPLVLQGQQKMEIEIEMTAPTKAEMTLQSFQVYLPTNIRQEFLSATRLTPLKLFDMLEIKKEQIEDVTSVPLQFNLPVQSLMILGTFDSVRLVVNGQTRFEGTLKEIQAINSFLTTTTDTENRIHFGLEDETFHFGGAFNMSRMDSVELEVTNADKTKNMSIFAEYYNVLKYQDGIYSLMFMD